METLTSVHNPALKDIRKAILRGSLTPSGSCIAESLHLLDEALRSGCEMEAVFAMQSSASRVQDRLRGEEVRLTIVPDAVFQTIATTETSQGVLALVKPPRWTLDELFARESPLLIMDGIQDPGNAGAMIRAAEAFMATGVVMLSGCVSPYNPKALRAAAGSTFRVALVSGARPEELLAALQKHKTGLFALMPSGSFAMSDCRLDRPCAVVIGNEGRGVSEQLLGDAVGLRIPTFGVESLNAAMAATIFLYEACRQRMARSSESL